MWETLKNHRRQSHTEHPNSVEFLNEWGMIDRRCHWLRVDQINFFPIQKLCLICGNKNPFLFLKRCELLISHWRYARLRQDARTMVLYTYIDTAKLWNPPHVINAMGMPANDIINDGELDMSLAFPMPNWPKTKLLLVWLIMQLVGIPSNAQLPWPLSPKEYNSPATIKSLRIFVYQSNPKNYCLLLVRTRQWYCPEAIWIMCLVASALTGFGTGLVVSFPNCPREFDPQV